MLTFDQQALTLVNHISDTDMLAVFAVWVLGLFAQRLGMVVYSIFALPGTVMHESAHYLMALVFAARPTFPSIIPKKENNSWRLGSVNFVPTVLNVIPVSLAPMLLMPTGILYAATLLHNAQGLAYLAHAWVTGTVIRASMPSSQDWKVAFPVLSVATVLGLGIFFLTK